MTQDELAEKLSVTRQAVSNWGREKTEPDLQTLDALAKTLNVSVEKLIYGDRGKDAKKLFFKLNIDVNSALAVGSAVAAVISYVRWGSIGWAILHGFLGWAYVIYYAIQF